MRIYLFILWTFLIVITGCTNQSKPDFETISIDKVLTKQQQGYIILDIREKNEFQLGHIQGAQNKPFTDLMLGDYKGLVHSQKYVVICRSGSRSKDASTILSKRGYHVTNVSKGMSSWQGDLVK